MVMCSVVLKPGLNTGLLDTQARWLNYSEFLFPSLQREDNSGTHFMSFEDERS